MTLSSRRKFVRGALAAVIWGIALLISTGTAHAQSGYAWVRSIGIPSSYVNGRGSFTGVTVDSSGNVYVVDNATGTIAKLDSQGNFLNSFGSGRIGGTTQTIYGSGFFGWASCIARDATGNFYVTDASNYSTIQKFDPNGRFLGNIGSPGSRLGGLSYPQGIRLDAAGNIYVANTGNNRVEKYTAEGIPVLRFYSLNGPSGVAVDGSGNVYVADTGNNRIVKFSPTGGILASYTKGAGNGAFSEPTDVAVDGAGNIYVADSGNNMIQKLNTAGKYIDSAFIWAGENSSPPPWLSMCLDSSGNLYVVNGQGAYNNGSGRFSPSINVLNTSSLQWTRSLNALYGGSVALDASGNTYTLDTFTGRLLKFDPTGKVIGNMPAPYAGIAADAMGNIYASDNANSKILKFSTFGGTPTVIAGPGNGSGQVMKPNGIFLDSAGNLYVADTGNYRVQKLTSSGQYLAVFGSQGTGNGQFSTPLDVFVDSAGNVYVADATNLNIQKFNSSAKFVLGFGSSGNGNGQFGTVGPQGVAVDNQGNIYATDYSNGRVEKFSSGGKYVAQYGGLNSPVGIRLDGSGNLVVASQGYISRINTNLQPVNSFCAFGSNDTPLYGPACVRLDSAGNLVVGGNGGVSRLTTGGTFIVGAGYQQEYATGIAFDSSGNIYVVDQYGDYVNKYNNNLGYIKGFGSRGSGTGQFYNPTGIALDSSGNLYITDSGNARVEKFNSNFTYLSQFGTQGFSDGQFVNPVGIAWNPNHNTLLIADNGEEADLVDVFGTSLGFPFLGNFGLFGSPFDITLDSSGNTYVADPGMKAVFVFAPSYNPLFSFGSYGAGSGQMGSPNSAVADANGTIYVADGATNRILVFAPTPTLTSVNPISASAGSPALQITLTGAGFTPNAFATFNGIPLTTTFVSQTSLTAILPAQQLATPGTFAIGVTQGAANSNTVPFTVSTSAPTIMALSPTNANAGTPSVPLTITGTNFATGALVLFGNSSLPTTFVSSTQLTSTIPGSLLTTAGTVSVTVQLAGLTSNAVAFTVNPLGPPPTITGITPPAVDAGSPTIALTVNGTGYTADAIVRFNGTPLATTVVSPSQLTVTIPANLLNTPGSYPVIVNQLSGTSNQVGFSVNAPAPQIFSFSPLNARVGTGPLTLTLTGLNFTSDAVVSFNNTALATAFVSATQVTAVIPASLLTTAGLFPFVLTEASGSTDPIGFAVNVAPPSVTGLSPTAVLRGSAAINLIVTGAGFTSDAVITLNGTALTTTFGSSTQLSATVPASLLTTSGFYPVIVKQASGVSRKVLFVVL